jgi:SPOR domain
VASHDLDAERCAQCGQPLAEEQEWCLNCGSSRTLIYRPPDWRAPVLVVVAVIVIALAGFVFALTRLSNSANKTAAESDTAGAAVPSNAGASIKIPTRTTATTPSGSHTTAATGLTGWPVGLDGWTVVLGRFSTEAAADARAAEILPSDARVGVLDSSDHPSMKAGYWVVFSGRYPNRAQARTAATTLLANGYPTAHAREVAPPGGL